MSMNVVVGTVLANLVSFIFSRSNLKIENNIGFRPVGRDLHEFVNQQVISKP